MPAPVVPDLKRRRESDPLDPWPSLPTTFEELLDFKLPSILKDASKTEKTADHSAKQLSPLFTEFSYFDDDVQNDLKLLYESIIADKEKGVFSTKSHQLWDSMAVDSCLRAHCPTVTGYSDERFVFRAAKAFNALAASLFTDILNWPSPADIADSIEPSTVTYAIHSGDLFLRHSQRGDKSSICIEQNQYAPRIMSGLSVEHKTHKVLMRHRSDLLLDHVFTNVRQSGSRAIIFELFLQMYCLECQLNNVIPVLHNLNDVDASVDEVDEESHKDLPLRVNYGMIFTAHGCVVAKRARGVDEAGNVIHGLALSDAHLITGPDADMPFLALLVAAYVPHIEDLPRSPPEAKWSTLLERIKLARTQCKEEQVRAVAEMEAENRKKDESADSGEGSSPGGPSAEGGDPGGSSGSRSGDGGNKEAGPEGGADDSRYLRLHFDAPDSSREPHILRKVSERGLRRPLVPLPPSSRSPSALGEYLGLSPKELTSAEQRIDFAPRLYLTHRLASGYIAEVFSGHLVTPHKPDQGWLPK
ncbi:hypothetical protein K438DRAFT_1868082 [Mycena galopus ATCC 62051]|nr:hypothetical protein K438DRAFT_1868082 [Mycena galopus ATCC 62051]